MFAGPVYNARSRFEFLCAFWAASAARRRLSCCFQTKDDVCSLLAWTSAGQLKQAMQSAPAPSNLGIADVRLHEEFVPLIFETFGACGQPTRAFFTRIAQTAQLSGFSRQRTLSSLAARVAIAIQKGNARTVLLALGSMLSVV